MTIGGQNVISKAKITYTNENPSCKNIKCWRLLKEALDSRDEFPIHYSTSGRPEWDPNNNWPFEGPWGVIINPKPNVVMWEIDPSGGFIAKKPPFAVVLWHELIGHGLKEIPSHPGTPENTFCGDPSNKYCDPAIMIENEARECLGVGMRVGQYHCKEPEEGERRRPR